MTWLGSLTGVKVLLGTMSKELENLTIDKQTAGK